MLNRILLAIAALFLTSYTIIVPQVARALPAAQKQLFGKNIRYFDLGCDTTGTTPATGGATDLDGKKVYMVGDSITEITTPQLEQAFKDAGASPTVDGVGGAAIVPENTPDTILSGVEIVEKDKATIRDAGVIVVALGTNEYPDVFEEHLKELFNKIRNINESSPIYWVNTFTSDDGGGNPAYTTAGAEKKNKIIDKQSTRLGFNVVDVKSANIKTTDGIHPFNDKEKYAKTVVDGVSGGAPSGGGGGGGGSGPSSVTAGNIPAEGKDVGATEYTGSTGYRGDDLTTTYAYAELVPGGHGTATEDTAKAMGGLKYKQKLAITLNGKTVVAQKLDIGLGGGPINGHDRAIDLHFDKTASSLGISSPASWAGVVHVQAVSDSTPLGPTDTIPTAEPPAAGAGGSCSCPAGGEGLDTTLTGSDHVEQAYNFFVGKGLTPLQSSIIVGVIMEESGHELDTTATNPSTGAYGIAQWTNPPYSNRLPELKDFARSQGKPASDFATQLNFMWKELTGGYTSTLNKLKSVSSPSELDQAVYDFEATYEVSGHQLIPERQDNARFVFSHYGGGVAGPGGGSVTIDGGGSCSEPSVEDANLSKTITVSTKGKFITLPSKYSCPGRTTVIDSRVAPGLAYLLTKYDMCAADGLADGHKSHGAGISVDLAPKSGNSKEVWKNSTEAAARAIGWFGDGATDPIGSQHGCAFYDGGYGQCMHIIHPDKIPKWVRWIGYNGDIDHGDPWHCQSNGGSCYPHLHISWDSPNGDATSATSIPEPIPEVYTFPAPVPDDLRGLLE